MEENEKEIIDEEIIEETPEEEIVEEEIMEELPKEKIVEEIINEEPKQKEETEKPKIKEKIRKGRNIFLIATFILVLLSLSVNAFVVYKGFELFGDAQWLVSANVCTKFDKQTWIDTHCSVQNGIEVCGFKDGYKNIILSLKQVEQINEKDLLFCSEYSPYGETFVRMVDRSNIEVKGG